MDGALIGRRPPLFSERFRERDRIREPFEVRSRGRRMRGAITSAIDTPTKTMNSRRK